MQDDFFHVFRSKKLVEPIKSYEQFCNSMFGWEYQKNAKLAHFTKEFLGDSWFLKYIKALTR